MLLLFLDLFFLIFLWGKKINLFRSFTFTFIFSWFESVTQLFEGIFNVSVFDELSRDPEAFITEEHLYIKGQFHQDGEKMFVFFFNARLLFKFQITIIQEDHQGK